MLVLAAVVVLVLWATAPRESATDAAQEYLDAIAAGDIERANELVPAVPDLGLPATADGRTAAAIAGWTPISEPQVVDSFETPEGTQVEVSYVVGDSTHTASLTVVPEEDTRILAESWQVTTPLALGVRVVSTGDGLPLTVGDLEIRAGRDAKVTLYPGSYQVAVEAGDYLAGEEYTLDVVPTSEGNVTRLRVLPEPTEALTDELTAWVSDALADCTIRDDGYVSPCQMHTNQARDGTTFEPVTWTVVDDPTIVEDETMDVVELRTTLRAEYAVADDHDAPRTAVSEEITLRTELSLEFESPESYEIVDVDWRTLPSGS